MDTLRSFQLPVSPLVSVYDDDDDDDTGAMCKGHYKIYTKPKVQLLFPYISLCIYNLTTKLLNITREPRSRP